GAEDGDAELFPVRQLDRDRLRRRRRLRALYADQLEQRIGHAGELGLGDEMAAGLNPGEQVAQAPRLERLTAVRQQQHAVRSQRVEVRQRVQLARAQAHTAREALGGEKLV